MSFYGTGQPNPVSNQAQMVRAAAGSLQPQLFGQLQFPQGSQTNPFEQNNHLLLQSQAQAQGFQNLNVSFLNEQLAGVLSQANASNASTMQNLMSPMAMTSLNFPSVPVGNVSQSGVSGQKQRVFTGTVTKAHDNFGFIDDEVFFTTAAVKGPILPKTGDRVLVEAEYNSTAPFKWNATRIQIVNIGGGGMGLSKTNSPQNSQQQNYQINVSAADKSLQGNRVIQNPLVAPPPPIISLTSQAGATSRHTTSTSSDGMNYSHVSIISNPHSVYSHSSSQQMQNPNTPITAASTAVTYQQAQAQRGIQAPVRGRMVVPMGIGVPMGVGDGLLPMQFNHNNPQIPSLFPATPEHNSSAATMDIIRNAERDLERMENRDRDRENRERERERDRERERERERERDKARREKEKARDAEREKEREQREKDRVARRRSPSPPPKKAKTDLWQERQANRGDRGDKDKGKEGERSRETDKVARNASPASSSASASRKRSRSRSRQRATEKDAANRSSRRDRQRASPRPRTRSRSRSSSQKSIARYNVVVPQYPLDRMDLAVMELKKRYQRLYIPSDFFLARACWLETFPLKTPLDWAKASPVVVFRRHSEQIDMGFIDYEPTSAQQKSTRKIEFIPDPEDARRLFSAKVMIMSNSGDSTVSTSNNIRRVMSFIVGLKLGKSDVQAIGGSWSASQDGPNPQSDPQVLIRTAIRTTKTSVGIDLSSCKRWFRFMELYYRRSNGVFETVVFFIPDISTCLPSEKEWRRIGAAYKFALGEAEDQSGKGKQKEGRSVSGKEEQKGTKTSKEPGVKEEEEEKEEVPTTVVVLTEEPIPEVKDEPSEVKLNESGEGEVVGLDGAVTSAGLAEITMEVDGESVEAKAESEVDSANTSLLIDEKGTSSSATPPGTPQLDPMLLNVAKLREELSHRRLSTKGLKAQLQVRLTEALEGEKVASSDSGEQPMDEDTPTDEVTTSTDKEKGHVDGVNAEVDSENVDSRTTSLIKPANGGEVKPKEAVKEELIEEEKESVLDDLSFGDVLVPLVPDDADEKTKEMWRRRFSLPKKPHVLVHPLQAGKTQDFDCSRMSLGSIREYRVHEVKEASFEVNLFSELFNEMLARDFAFKIYKEAVIRTQLTSPADETEKKGDKKDKAKDEKGSEDKTKEEKSKDDKGKEEKPLEEEKKVKEKEVKKEVAEVKKTDKKGDEVGDSKKSSSRPASAKAAVTDGPLHLAFSFFDTGRCGYIKEIDFEEICLICGLNLTRSQIRKITQKVFEKESQFRYSLWTENPLQLDTQVQEQLSSSIQAISSGNNELLPVFVYEKKGSESPAGGVQGTQEESLLVPLNGTLVDVRKLKEQNEKYEGERGVLEANLNALTNNMVDAQLQVADLKKSTEGWKSEYLKLKESAKASELLTKTQADDLDTFRRASERFIDRVKGVVDMKGRSHSSAKDGNGSTSRKEAETKSEAKA